MNKKKILMDFETVSRVFDNVLYLLQSSYGDEVKVPRRYLQMFVTAFEDSKTFFGNSSLEDEAFYEGYEEGIKESNTCCSEDKSVLKSLRIKIKELSDLAEL